MTPHDARSLRQALIAVAAGLALVLVYRAYAPAQDGAFIWDDHVLAEAEHAPFRDVPLAKLFTGALWPDETVGEARGAYFRPLVLVSLRFDAALGGTAPDYHLTNILLHLLACCLLAVTARRLGAKTGAALLAALAWGLAPRLTESVGWISGRTDVLAGVLGFAALAVAPDVAVERPRSRTLVGVASVASGALLLGALLAKEIAVAFVAALAVPAVYAAAKRHGPSAIARTSAIALLPLAAWAALRAAAIGARRGPAASLGLVERTGTVLEAVGRYAEMIADFARPQTSIGEVGEIDVARAALGGVLVVALVALVVVHRRRLGAGVRIALVLTLASLAPVLHAVPVSLAGAVTADRLLYVPLGGIAIALAIFASALGQRARTAAAAVVLVVSAVSFAATHRRATDYTDEPRFWVVAAEHAHPRNVAARNALALVVQRAGDVGLSCRLYERSAHALGETHLVWTPQHRRTLEALANCWARDGRYEEAIRLAEDLTRRFPTIARLQIALGFARLHVRDFDGAIAAFKKAEAIAPSDGALAKVAEPILADIPRTRADAERFAAPDTAAREPLAYARHLADLGRAPEADAAFLAIALDTSLPHNPRHRAIDFLVFDGRVSSAERVVGLTEGEIRRHVLEEHVRERTKRLARVEALRDRIEALTR